MNVELKPIKYNDFDIVDVARVSYGKESSNYTEEQNIKLLNYLAKKGHTSPFRHVQLQFIVKCPIYVERQIFKHAVGISVNSISGRYVDFSDTYYEIEQFRKQSKDSKQGSDEDLGIEDNNDAKEIQADIISICKLGYNRLLHLGVSKEQARSVLPLSLETEFRWSGTLLAFIHLCNLRIKPDTQKETRDLVTDMLNLVKEDGSFKHSLLSFGF